jgi:chaperonin GroEL
MEACFVNKTPLLIIAPCSGAMAQALSANVIHKGFPVCAVYPPSAGWRQHELLGDIADALGAKFISQKSGDNAELITYQSTGKAKRIVADRDMTVITKDENVDVSEKVAQLQQALQTEKNRHNKDFIRKRIASLDGGVGVVYAGGDTPLEQKELYDRIDDAICAVRSAREEGILPGGGIALRDEADRLVGDSEAINMLRNAMRVPINQMLTNCGLKYDEIYKDERGYNIKTGQYGDMIEMGVIDPAKVVKSALRSAVSVATTILSTDTIITVKQ